MEHLAWLRILCLTLTCLSVLFFSYQVFYLFFPFFKKIKRLPEAAPRRYGILIAARNEQAVLPLLLDSIAKQDYPQDMLQVFVIADNCTDNTAQIAREHGATVYLRNSTKKIGKGYALDYLLTKIKSDFGYEKFDAFMVFDADNLLEPDYFKEINRVCGAGYEAFCGYRNTKNFGTNWLTSGYGLWYIHESTHMNRSRMMMGTGCCVSGTGFGFTTQLLERLGGWKFFTLTEDLEFGAWCASHGVKIGYCNDAVLYDEQPLTFCQSWRQRTRWSQGGIQVAFRYIGCLFKGIFSGNWSSYTCFELITLSLWGVLYLLLGSLLTTISIGLHYGWLHMMISLVFGLFLSYCISAFMALLTLAKDWRRIRATRKEKIRSMFTFPFFMITWLPINLAAPFQKFTWAPIEHTVAVSADSLHEETE